MSGRTRTPLIVIGCRGAVSCRGAGRAGSSRLLGRVRRRTQPVELEGVVTKLQWTNPHSWIYVDVNDASGDGHDLGRRVRLAVRAAAQGLAQDRLPARRARSPSKATARAAARPIANASSVALADGRGFYTAAEDSRRGVRGARPSERHDGGSEHDTGTQHALPRLRAPCSRLGCCSRGGDRGQARRAFRARPTASRTSRASGRALSGADYDLEPHAGRPDAPPAPVSSTAACCRTNPWAVAQRDRELRRSARRRTIRGSSATRSACRARSTSRRRSRSSSATRDLTLVGSFGAVRTIHTNGTQHPEGPFGFWLGDSRAHWEGDTLVVDVVDFNDETWLDRAGNFHSDALHVVERWTLLDANTIEYRRDRRGPEGVHASRGRLNVLLQRHREPDSSSSRTTASRTSTTSSTPFRRLAPCRPRAAGPSSSAAIGEPCDTKSASPMS